MCQYIGSVSVYRRGESRLSLLTQLCAAPHAQAGGGFLPLTLAPPFAILWLG